MTNLLKIYEGGAAIPDSVPVAKDDVQAVVAKIKNLLPSKITKNMQINIGSAGFKVQSGDIDIMIEAQDVVDFFATQNSPDPVKDAKQLLKKHFEKQGFVSVVSGRNVHIGVPYQTISGKKALAQADIMVIDDAAIVAPWHQHGLRGAYDDPEFKGKYVFILLNSLAKHMNLKFDSFGAKLINRDTNEVVGRTRKQVAKILIGSHAKESDLDSVKSIMAALESDPDSEGKLAQARQDVAKGLLRLPETALPGTAAWFRQITNRIP
jgi:hypothetical protein